MADQPAKPQGFFFTLESAWAEEWKRSWSYKIVTFISALITLLSAVGLFYNPLVDWSKRTRGIVFLATVIVFLLALLYALYKYQARKCDKLADDYNGLVRDWNILLSEYKTEVEQHARLKVQTEQLAADKKEVEELLEKADERLRAKIEIWFQDRPPYVETTPYRLHGGIAGNYHERTYRFVRIGIHNSSGSTVQDVSVFLDMFSQDGRSYDEIPFRIKDDAPPYKTSFPLVPGQTQFVDIAMREHRVSTREEPRLTILCHTRAPGIEEHIRDGYHHLSIRVVAGNAPPAYASFKLDTDTGGLLILEREEHPNLLGRLLTGGLKSL